MQSKALKVVSTVKTPTDLLEREDDLASLDRALAEAEARSGRLVLVAGEAGVGKTTLVQTFAQRARGRVRVVKGVCEALFTPRPLGPLYDIAQDLRGPLLDALSSGSERVTIFADFLGELKSTPTLVVLEDVHWADEATLDAISYVGRRLDNTRSLVVITFRDDELTPQHPLRLAVGELPSGSTMRIRLEPLSPDGVEQLARRAGRAADGLYAATGGNPFFVTEVLATDERDIPRSVRDAVLARTARLSPPARRLLEAVSIVPGEAELWVLERLASDEMPYLGECISSGVLGATSRGVEFRHELARMAVEGALGPDRRLQLNRAAVEAVANPPYGEPDLTALTHHAEAAGDGDAVLRYAPAAGKRASRLGAHREAAAQYQRAIGFSDGLPLERQAALYERLSYELYLTGDFADGMEATSQALARYRTLRNVLKEGDCLHALSRLLWSSGHTPEARDVGRQAVELLESLPPGHELAMAYTQLASLSLIRDDLEEVVLWATRAANLADELDAREIAAVSHVTLGAAEYAAGSADGRARLENELADALSRGFDEVAARAYNLLIRFAVRSREYAVVDRYLDAGFEFCRDRELGNFRQGLGAERARRLLDGGQWGLATDAADLVLSTARTAGMAPFIALTVLGQVRARRGDPEVWAPLDRALEMAEPTEELQRLGLVAAARAEAAWLAGDRRQTLAETDSAFELALETRHSWFLGELAYWRWKAGALDRPPEIAAEPFRLQVAGAWKEAAAAWFSYGCPYEAARALSESTDEVALREALVTFDGLGAVPASRMTRQILRSLGASVPRGPRHTTRENPAQLTARELEVLGLVAAGLRNAEIADRLVVSRRTVDHHVSAILRKLGARTRGEAIAAAGRLGLT